MKVAIITAVFLPALDGVSTTVLNRIQKLSEWGHQVLLFCPSYSEISHIYPNWQNYTGEILPGVQVINLPSSPFLGMDFDRNVKPSSYRRVLKELEKFQPDIIHIDEPERLFLGFFTIPGVSFAKKHRIPCVSFFHTNYLEYIEDYLPIDSRAIKVIQFVVRQLLLVIYKSYNITLVSSSMTHDKIKKMGIKKSIYSDLYGFETAKFKTVLKQDKFFLETYSISDIDSKLKLIFLGRLAPDKGWNFTIKAFSQVAQEIDLERVAIIIAGDGDLRDKISQSLGSIVPNIHFLGRVSPEVVPALLANCDIHVTSSEKETKGITILEAFAAGIPVIAPRAGGVVDEIRDGWNGFLFTPQCIHDFSQKLKILIENPYLREEMGDNARQYVVKHSYDNTVKNLVEIWDDQIRQNESNQK